MNNHSDSVDRALMSLANRHWPETTPDHQLEQRLMNSCQNRPPASLFARHRTLICALAVLALAGVATGAVGLAKGWFATVSVNGKIVHSGELVPDENGRATITVPPGTLREGENQVSVSMDAADEGPKTVTVTVNQDDVTVQTDSQPQSTKNDK